MLVLLWKKGEKTKTGYMERYLQRYCRGCLTLQIMN